MDEIQSPKSIESKFGMGYTYTYECVEESFWQWIWFSIYFYFLFHLCDWQLLADEMQHTNNIKELNIVLKDFVNSHMGSNYHVAYM